MPLSSLAVQNAKRRDNFYTLTDGGGLHLLFDVVRPLQHKKPLPGPF
jgi:hypothetical protein